MQYLGDLKQEASSFVSILVFMSSWTFVLSWDEHGMYLLAWWIQHLRDLKQETSSFVSILVFMGSWNFVFSWVEHGKRLITPGPCLLISLFVYIWILVSMKSPAQVAMFYNLKTGESPNLFFKVPKSLVLIFRDISCLASELTVMN